MYLLAQDTVNGAEGSIFVTRDGKNEQIAGMRNIKTQADIQSTDMKVIGTRLIQDKPNGVKMSGSGNIYYGSNTFLDMLLEYIKTGVMPEFTLQIINKDPATSIGQQNMVYYGCKLTGSVPMSILNDEEELLNYDFSFSISKVSRLKKFKDPKKFG